MPLARGPARAAPRSEREARREALREDVARGRVRRVLAIRFARLGDILFTTPAVSRLAEALPEARIDYLTRSAGRALVEQHPAVSEVLCFEPGWHRPGQLLARRALRRHIAARAYDLALIFESDRPTRTFLESLCRAAGVRHVVSRSSVVRPPGEAWPEHSCEKHMQLLAMLGIETDGRPYQAFASPEAGTRAEAFLVERGYDPAAPGRPLLVGIQAGCHYSRFPEWLLRRTRLRHKFHKAWPYARWSEVGDLLAAELSARVVLTGVRGERGLAEGIARDIHAPPGLEPIVAAGETDVAALIALVARTDLFVSIDTGPMHLAAALGVPTVALFGPTNPRHHGPWGPPGRSVVLRTGIACSPCDKAERRACPVNACLTEISPRRVFEAGRGLLEVARAARAG